MELHQIYIYKTYTYKFIAFMFFLNFGSNLYCQQKINVGLGFNVGTGKINDSDNSKYLGIPIGFSINTDYTLNKQIKIKAAFEIKSQSLDILNEYADRVPRFSLPVLLNYGILNKNDKNWKVEIEGGFGLDMYSKIDVTLLDQVGLLKAKIQSLNGSNVFKAPNLHARFGLNYCRKYKNNSHVNIYLHYIRSVQNFSFIYFETHKFEVINVGYSSKTSRDIIDLGLNGLQFGIYFTLGKKTM